MNTEKSLCERLKDGFYNTVAYFQDGLGIKNKQPNGLHT